MTLVEDAVLKLDKVNTPERRLTPSSPDTSDDSNQDDAVSASTEAMHVNIHKLNDTEFHLNILAELLPEGTIVTEGAIERISRAFAALIEATSDNAANKALARFNWNNLTATRQGPKKARGNKKAKVAANSTSRTTPNKTANAILGKRKNDFTETEEEEQDEFEVESILTHKLARNGGLTFHIKWRGYPATVATWEDKGALVHCQEILKEYAKEHRLAL
ncbi:hypothetical protein EC968_005949 [Mortierella alpina]|nr:hypothetical protein EC968_005949 [Mortierella alpina]